MSAEVFNRIARLEAEIAALKARVVVLELSTQPQVRESERPSKPTLQLRTKGEPSRA